MPRSSAAERPRQLETPVDGTGRLRYPPAPMVEDLNRTVSSARPPRQPPGALAVLVSICVALLLGACGSSAPATSTPSPPVASTAAASVQANTPTATTGSSTQPSAAATGSQHSTPTKAPKSPGPAPHITAKAKAVLAGFVACMRKHGIDYPQLNLSGHGKAVKRGQLDPRSPKFKAAQLLCSKALATELKRLGFGAGQTHSG